MTTEYERAQLTLARISVADNRSLRQALREVCQVTAATMQIARISIWLFMQDKQVIRCEYLYQPDCTEAFEGTLLHRNNFPHYFKATENQRAVPVAGMSDPGILAEFLEPYMIPLAITAMLDAPIYRSGEVIGIICHEQVSTARSWNTEDTQLAGSTADTVSRLYEEAARQQAELMLHTHQNHAQELERVASMGHMAAGVAHDFKNILHGIMAYADMIATVAGHNPQIQALVDKQIATVDIGTQLAQDLLSLGRNGPSQPHVVNVGDVIEQYLPILEKVVGYQISITTHFPAGICRVFVDNSQLERVLLNLVLNARDAMPDGGTINIKLYEAHRPPHTDDNGLYVTIEVADSGTGMDDDTLKKLFQPYFTTKGTKGTGLGMTIVQQIITMAGGFIDIESQPGSGTKAYIRLPRIGSAQT